MYRNSDQIYDLYMARKNSMVAIHAAGAVLQSIYEGSFSVELDKLNTTETPAIANLIQTGLDQHGMRISSVMPNIICPPLRPSKTAEKKANQRKLALQAWWHVNRIPLKMGRRARHLAGYAMSPVLVRPGNDGYPVWEVKDPLCTYPADTAPGDLVPADCIFAFERTGGWLKQNYPEYALTIGRDVKQEEKVKILQYISAEQYSLVALGKTDNSYGAQEGTVSLTLVEVENRANVPCVIVPGRITLSGLQGQFDQLVGMYAAQAQLWALQIHAAAREVFAETWIQSTNQGGTPNMAVKADPYNGEVGVVENGQIQSFRNQSAQGPIMAINQLERNQRITGAIPAEMGGESASNVRTGRRGGQIFAAAVDPYVQEHQNVLAASLEEEDKVAIAIAKAYWPDTPKTFVIPIAKGQVSYTPSVTFDTDAHAVSYAYAGADTNGLVIEGGQRVAMGTMSKITYMGIDPLIDDPDAEHDRIVQESLENAMLQSILQQAAMPDGPWSAPQLGRLMELVYTQNMELWEAVAKVQAELQDMQAQAADPQAQLGAGGQPGLEQGGAPGTAGAAIPTPGNPSQMNLSMLLNNLRTPQRGPLAGAPGATA
jgi:hypothetical protein